MRKLRILVMGGSLLVGSLGIAGLAGAAQSGATLARRANAVTVAAERLQDFESIKHLQRAYGYYLDKGFWDEAADLFAPDATFESGVDGVYVGKERIRQLIVRYGGGNPGPGLPYGQYNHHMQLQPVVHVSADGQTAKGRWREFALLGQFGKFASWGEGVYECDYSKQDNVWRIQALHFYPDFVAPYAGGWARLPAAADDWRTDVAKSFPADRPPTQQYKPFPDVFAAPFHYQRLGAGVVVPGDKKAVATTSSVKFDSHDPGFTAANVAALEGRLARLAARAEIENLQGAYGYYIDKGRWQQAANLFSEHGTYEFGQLGVYVGRDHVRKALGLFGAEGLEKGQLNNYPMLQPIVDVSPDNRSAKARWRSDVQLARNGKGQWGEGEYENEYVRENGVWKISTLHYYVTFVADYDAGWIDGAVPMEGPSKDLPPDRAPTERYESLPGVHIPPYHYVHPVTGQPSGITSAAAADGIPGGAGLVFASGGGAVNAGPGEPVVPPALHEVDARITRLEDIAAIEKVQRAYGYYVDKAMWVDVANLFADNGTVEIGGRGRFVGKRRALEYYVVGLGPIGISTRHGGVINHQQFQGIVDVDSDGKTGHGRWTAFVMGGGPGPGTAIWGDCYYENEYVKEGGVWKIAKLRGPFNMYSLYKEGWAKQAVPNTRPDSFAPPPDLPPSVLYMTYPSFYVAPFHYPNPVTGKPMPPVNPGAGGMAPMSRMR